MKIRAIRYHDISCGHRVVGHEGKCRFLHGHNYRVIFHCEAEELDQIGRVIDFGMMKARLCMWLENAWDHKFLAWEEDKVIVAMLGCLETDESLIVQNSIVLVPFNPTAENMADYLLNVICPSLLFGTGVLAVKVEIEETRKCSVSCEL